MEVEERKEEVGVQVPESDWVGPLCPATSLSWGWGGEVDWGVGRDNELEVMVGHDVFDVLGTFEFFVGRGDIQEGALEFGREIWAEEGQRCVSEMLGCACRWLGQALVPDCWGTPPLTSHVTPSKLLKSLSPFSPLSGGV